MGTKCQIFLEAKIIFKLPPSNSRWIPPKSVCKKLFGTYITSAEDDVQYLFFLQFKYRFIVGIILSSFLWLTYELDLKIIAFGRDFGISRDGDFVTDFSITFCYMFLAIEFFCIKPFFNYFLKKIRKGNEGLFHFQKLDRSQPVAEMKKRLNLVKRLGFIFLAIFYFGSPTLGLFFASRFEAKGSENFLTWLAIILPVVFSYLWGWIFMLENGYKIFKRLITKIIHEKAKGYIDEQTK